MEPGSWVDHGLVFNSTTGDDFNAIDPNLSIDEHGNPVLSFGNFYSSAPPLTCLKGYRLILGSYRRPIRILMQVEWVTLQDDIFQVSLSKDLRTVISSPVQASFNSTSPNPEEGAFIWEHDSFFYLFVSSGKRHLELPEVSLRNKQACVAVSSLMISLPPAMNTRSVRGRS
jgi:arabinan endo-1,5-alpha-L-arabinosidase